MNDLKFYEDFLLKKRGWISKWPTCAVFIYSGGLDSTITMARLLKEKKIELFPLFINRGQTNLVYEKRSTYFFENFFQKKYGKKFHNLTEININIPPKEIKKELIVYTQKYGHPLRNTILQMIGVQYAVSLCGKLERGDKEKIATVLCAQVPDDPFPHSSLTSLRATTIDVCQGLGEWDWQITSPNIDQYLTPERIDKPKNIRWAYEHKIPIERTRSCYTPNEAHCGICLTCRRRKEAFLKAEVTDKTKYLS